MTREQSDRNILHNQKGITLVILVITAIITIILASVAIGFAINKDNGAIEATKRTSEKYANGVQEDKIDRTKVVKELNNDRLGLQSIDEEKIDYRISEFKKGVVGEAISNKGFILADDYNNIVKIPKGFQLASDSGDNVAEGIIIEDKITHSQFVWIPVEEIYSEKSDKLLKIDFSDALGRYQNGMMIQSAISYENNIEIPDLENENDSYIEEENVYSGSKPSKANDIGAFINSVKENGGFYIGRYLARDSNTQGVNYRINYASLNNLNMNEIAEMSTLDIINNVLIKLLNDYSYTTLIDSNNIILGRNKPYYNHVSQSQASQKCIAMYQDSAEFTSDLVNSYAYDTTLYIANYLTSIGYPQIENKIQDIGNNIAEWTTETAKNQSETYNVVRLNKNRKKMKEDFSNYTQSIPTWRQAASELAEYERKLKQFVIYDEIPKEHQEEIIREIVGDDIQSVMNSIEPLLDESLLMLPIYVNVFDYNLLSNEHDMSEITDMLGMFDPRNYYNNPNIETVFQVEGPQELQDEKYIIHIAAQGAEFAYDDYTIKGINLDPDSENYNQVDEINLGKAVYENKFFEAYRDYEAISLSATGTMPEAGQITATMHKNENDLNILRIQVEGVDEESHISFSQLMSMDEDYVTMEERINGVVAAGKTASRGLIQLIYDNILSKQLKGIEVQEEDYTVLMEENLEEIKEWCIDSLIANLNAGYVTDKEFISETYQSEFQEIIDALINDAKENGPDTIKEIIHLEDYLASSGIETNASYQRQGLIEEFYQRVIEQTLNLPFYLEYETLPTGTDLSVAELEDGSHNYTGTIANMYTVRECVINSNHDIVESDFTVKLPSDDGFTKLDVQMTLGEDEREWTVHASIVDNNDIALNDMGNYHFTTYRNSDENVYRNYSAFIDKYINNNGALNPKWYYENHPGAENITKSINQEEGQEIYAGTIQLDENNWVTYHEFVWQYEQIQHASGEIHSEKAGNFSFEISNGNYWNIKDLDNQKNEYGFSVPYTYSSIKQLYDRNNQYIFNYSSYYSFYNFYIQYESRLEEYDGDIERVISNNEWSIRDSLRRFIEDNFQAGYLSGEELTDLYMTYGLNEVPRVSKEECLNALENTIEYLNYEKNNPISFRPILYWKN